MKKSVILMCVVVAGLGASGVLAEQTADTNTSTPAPVTEMALREQAKVIQLRSLKAEAIARFNKANHVVLAEDVKLDQPVLLSDYPNRPVSGWHSYEDLNGRICELTVLVYDHYSVHTCFPIVDRWLGCRPIAPPLSWGEDLNGENRKGRIVSIEARCALSGSVGVSPLRTATSDPEEPIEAAPSVSAVRAYLSRVGR